MLESGFRYNEFLGLAFRANSLDPPRPACSAAPHYDHEAKPHADGRDNPRIAGERTGSGRAADESIRGVARRAADYRADKKLPHHLHFALALSKNATVQATFLRGLCLGTAAASGCGGFCRHLRHRFAATGARRAGGLATRITLEVDQLRLEFGFVHRGDQFVGTGLGGVEADNRQLLVQADFSGLDAIDPLEGFGHLGAAGRAHHAIHFQGHFAVFGLGVGRGQPATQRGSQGECRDQITIHVPFFLWFRTFLGSVDMMPGAGRGIPKSAFCDAEAPLGGQR